VTLEELQFFTERREALPLYETLSRWILTEFPGVTVKVQKSQITFKERYGFAFVSLRRIKGCPEVFIVVTFGLSHRLDSPRIAVAVEPYPSRWTHHVVLSDVNQIDGELMDWIREAHDFALIK
jgi:hypothetical protein